MKLILGSLIGIIILFFGVKVKVLDATSQEWYGGQYESGKGTDYNIKLLARGGSDKLAIDKLWIEDDFYEVKAIKNPAKRSELNFAKRDTIYVRAAKKLLPDENGRMLEVTGKGEEPPREFSGMALLAYTWKGKRKYKEIKDLRKLERIIYP